LDPGDGGEAPVGGASLTVEVVYCAARGQADLTALTLPAGATLADAVRASGLLDRHPGLDVAAAGIWSRPSPPSQPLRDGDRVELYRALTVEPKEARRERHRQATGRKRRA
jgi:uncharacterized protein